MSLNQAYAALWALPEAERKAKCAGALDRAYADIDSGARRSAAYTVKRRARHYREHPSELEVAWPGLSASNGEKLIAIGEHLLEAERAPRTRRLFGFGGEVPAVNAKAIIILGRYLRRFETRIPRMAAE